MNKARLRQAADWVLNDGLRLGRARVGFNMQDWISDGSASEDRGPLGTCSTTACIAGTVAIGADLYRLYDVAAADARKGIRKAKLSWFTPTKLNVIAQEAASWARLWLGLTDGQADALFTPDCLRFEYQVEGLDMDYDEWDKKWILLLPKIPHTLAYHTMMHLHDTGEVDWQAGVARLLAAATKTVELELAQ